MNTQYLTDYPLDGYLHSRRSRLVALRRDRFNLRPLFESLGWVLAGATVGSVAVMMGAWGLVQLTEPTQSHTQTITAATYSAPQILAEQR
jgi:hypothetical protein